MSATITRTNPCTAVATHRGWKLRVYVSGEWDGASTRHIGLSPMFSSLREVVAYINAEEG